VAAVDPHPWMAPSRRRIRHDRPRFEPRDPPPRSGARLALLGQHVGEERSNDQSWSLRVSSCEDARALPSATPPRREVEPHVPRPALSPRSPSAFGRAVPARRGRARSCRSRGRTPRGPGHPPPGSAPRRELPLGGLTEEGAARRVPPVCTPRAGESATAWRAPPARSPSRRPGARRAAGLRPSRRRWHTSPDALRRRRTRRAGSTARRKRRQVTRRAETLPAPTGFANVGPLCAGPARRGRRARQHPTPAGGGRAYGFSAV
jgi:hypothetical protein